MKRTASGPPRSAHVPRMLDIRWEDGFEAALVQAVSDAEVRAEVEEHIEWLLARRAEERSLVFNGYRVYRTNAFADTPKLRVYFKIEGEVVALHRIERDESSPAW
jgi:hypothetical protein